MITSVQNPLVKQLRKLHRAKERSQQGLFLLEGTHLIQEAQGVGVAFENFCCTEDWQDKYPQLFEQCCHQSQRVELIGESVLQAIATTVTPDGVVATAPRWHQQLPPIHTFGLALEAIQDPGNLGTMIRTAAAARVEGLWLSDTSVDLDNPKVLRASAGQWFRLPMSRTPRLVDTLRHHQAAGFQVISTLPQAQQPYWAVDFRPPTLILLGNEGQGLSPELRAIANQAVQIPLSDGVESLNVAIAAALLMYEVRRQRS
ncbi:MAG: RNA methyltransferase [Synechococcales bacterium]|nr:RNA methyltransferase [Synechococcales bacterium]